jgi:hypothetical protein
MQRQQPWAGMKSGRCHQRTAKSHRDRPEGIGVFPLSDRPSPATLKMTMTSGATRKNSHQMGIGFGSILGDFELGGRDCRSLGESWVFYGGNVGMMGRFTIAYYCRYDYREAAPPKIDDADFLDLLHSLYILEYRNDGVWYGLHPIVKDILRRDQALI